MKKIIAMLLVLVMSVTGLVRRCRRSVCLRRLRGQHRCLRIQRSFFDSSFCTGRGRSTYL